MKTHHTRGALMLILCLMVAAAAGQDPEKRDKEVQKKQRMEEADASKYYDRWVNQDVVYLITDEEREVFEKLTTAEERDRFIEQFWQRRDTDLRTAVNEAREEHYRRIAHANQHFGSGIPGWKADRGRIYIMFGPPAQIEYFSGGGTYVRPGYEGGGRTATYPFEIWRYRHLDGIGDDVEIEFVDRSWTGEFKIAQWPWEKDMLLHVDGLGETTSERLGLTSRAQRPGLHPGNLNNTLFMTRHYGQRFKDRPFERLGRYFALQKPPEIKQKELQTIVNTKVSFQSLPFDNLTYYIWLNESQALLPITIQIPNIGLTYEPKTDALYKARVGIYGRVTSLTGKIVAEFEDVVSSNYSSENLEVGRHLKSLYQKSFLVDPGRYKIDIVVKDLTSGNLGTTSESVRIPEYAESELTAGDIILAERLQQLEDFAEKPESFVLGDVRVVPKVTRQFKSDERLGVYLQVYNPSFDMATEAPSVQIEYSISNGDRLVSKVTDHDGTTINYAAPDRLVLLQSLALDQLQKGRYRLTIKVDDLVSGQSSTAKTDFEVLGD